MTTTSIRAVDDLLEAFSDGAARTVADLYADDAVLDATVPGWRFEVRGSRSIARQYAEWLAVPGRFDELERRPTADGEVVVYLFTWVDRGVPHAVHRCHVLEVGEDGRITRDTVFCGGVWDAARLAQIQEAQNV